MEAFGVDDMFTPERPVRLGERRGRHQHRPYSRGADGGDEAQRDRARTSRPAAASRSSPGSPTTRDSHCPPTIALPVVEALAPYNLQIAALQAQIGAVIPRQNMKDKSGATVMDPQTPGDERPRPFRARSRAAAAGSEFRSAARARDRRRKRPRHARHRGRGRDQSRRRSRRLPPPRRRARPAIRPTP